MRVSRKAFLIIRLIFLPRIKCFPLKKKKKKKGRKKRKNQSQILFFYHVNIRRIKALIQEISVSRFIQHCSPDFFFFFFTRVKVTFRQGSYTFQSFCTLRTYSSAFKRHRNHFVFLSFCHFARAESALSSFRVICRITAEVTYVIL